MYYLFQQKVCRKIEILEMANDVEPLLISHRYYTKPTKKPTL